jgi:hypothetical protein
MSTDESRASNQRSSTRSRRGFFRRAGSSTRSRQGFSRRAKTRTQTRRGFSRRAKTCTRTRRVVLSPHPTALPQGQACGILWRGSAGSRPSLHPPVFDPVTSHQSQGHSPSSSPRPSTSNETIFRVLNTVKQSLVKMLPTKILKNVFR